MQATLQETVSLQLKFSASKTPAMDRRGQLVRKLLPAEIASHGARIQTAMGRFGADATVQGKDNFGQNSYVPWVRWFSKSRAPSATSGWYIVYLFHPDGSGVSLCLSHGSNEMVGTGFVERSDAEVAELMAWAATVLGAEFASDPDVRLGVSLGKLGMAPSYERTTVVSKFYASGAVPSDDVLVADLERFARPLARLYEAQEMGVAPGSISVDVLGGLSDIERAASPLKSKPGQGRGLTGPQRKAVELHAMAAARLWLQEQSFAFTDVSSSDSCDFRARKAGQEWVIEVKGTTGGPGTILLTRNEVALHKTAHPLNALLIVHGIKLDEVDLVPRPSGGELLVITPWMLDDERLSPVCFEYRVPLNQPM